MTHSTQSKPFIHYTRRIRRSV